MRTSLLSIIFLFFIGTIFVYAQDQPVTVPDVVGLNVPEAAAELNRNGLNLGMQTPSTDSDAAPNTIVTQSLAPGTQVERGTAVDLVVVLPSNTRLIYDDNDITVINLNDTPTHVTGLIFTSVEGTSATFAASVWANDLRENQCFQLWSVNRNGPKDVEGCQFIQAWRTTTDTAAHFWTQANGVQRFAVLENGIQRAICDAAPPNSQDNPTTCEFYLAGGSGADEATDFVYFSYTSSAIALFNSSDDRWMPTSQTNIYNYNPNLSNPGAALIFGDPNLLQEQYRVGLGDITQLAPQQCLVFTVTGTAGELPEACDVVAQRDLGPEIAFWLAAFEVGSITDGQRHDCPAATANRLTRCIVPR